MRHKTHTLIRQVVNAWRCGRYRWWDATVVGCDADARDDQDQGVFLEFDDGDQAYRKLGQLRLALPFPIGGEEAAEGHGDGQGAAEPGQEVLVQTRQYTHNGEGPFHEWTRAELVQLKGRKRHADDEGDGE